MSSFRDRLVLASCFVTIVVLILALVGTLALTIAQGSLVADTHNYTGDGNHFTISATVVGVGSESVTVSQVHVIYAQGEARSWFGSTGLWFVGPRHLELQNNFTHNDKQVVGVVNYPNGYPTTLSNLFPGQHVVVTGSIRTTDIDGKTGEDRAVYWTITIQPDH